MIFKCALVLSVIAISAANPLSYVQAPNQGQQIAAPAQPQYRYVQQPQQAQYQQPQQVAAAAQYQPQPQAQQPLPQRKLLRPQAAEQEEYEPPQPYQFAFDVRDDLNTNYQNRQEQREGDTVKGSYSVVDSDGFIRTVKYSADPLGGFKAEVSREPTDIKIIVPTPAPASLSARQHQTQQYLQAGPQYQSAQPQAYAAPRPAPQRYTVAQPVASQAQQYAAAAPAPQQQIQYAAAPAQRPRAYAPQAGPQYQGYAQQ